MGQVIHLHHAGIFGRRVPVDAPFVRREVITTPSAQPAAETPEAAGVLNVAGLVAETPDLVPPNAHRSTFLRGLDPTTLTKRQQRELSLLSAAETASDPAASAEFMRKAFECWNPMPEPLFLQGTRGDYLRGLPPSERTARQVRELALIDASLIARDRTASEMLMRKADQVALGIPAPMSLPPIEAIDPVCPVEAVTEEAVAVGGGIDVRRKPVTLVPWILGLLAVAALLAVFPPLFS